MAAVPQEMKDDLSTSELHGLFDSVDTDSSGEVSMEEFFLWTLAVLHTHTGSGIEDILRQYDRTGDGLLDSDEFAVACQDLGFGSMADELFMELDPDSSGSISAAELLGAIQHCGGTSRVAKRFLYGLAAGTRASRLELDTSSWRLDADNLSTLRIELLEYLQKNDPPAKTSELYLFMSHGGRPSLSEDGFSDAFERLGLPAEQRWLAVKLYQELDADQSGRVGERDLTIWLNEDINRRRHGESAHCLTLLKPLARDEDDWHPQALRLALQRALIQAGLSPPDLMRAWDGDFGGTLARKEFMRNVKRAVDDNKLWEAAIRKVALQTFDEVSGGDRIIDAIEFQRWMSKGWRTLRAQAWLSERERPGQYY